MDVVMGRSLSYQAMALALSEDRPPELFTADGVARMAEALDRAGAPIAAQELRGHFQEPPEREVVRLFGHAAQGVVPPFETEYGFDPTFRQPAELADIAGFYRAFGLGVEDRGSHRPDHVATECEFMAFLAMREKLALEASDPEMLEVIVAAERAFLVDHLGRFARAFGGRLAREAGPGAYAAIGRALSELVGADCARFGVDGGPQDLPLRTPVEEVVPMACGDGCGGGCP
jgi:TorA maturation chaperone TorD